MFFRQLTYLSLVLIHVNMFLYNPKLHSDEEYCCFSKYFMNKREILFTSIIYTKTDSIPCFISYENKSVILKMNDNYLYELVKCYLDLMYDKFPKILWLNFIKGFCQFNEYSQSGSTLPFEFDCDIFVLYKPIKLNIEAFKFIHMNLVSDIFTKYIEFLKIRYNMDTFSHQEKLADFFKKIHEKNEISLTDLNMKIIQKFLNKINKIIKQVKHIRKCNDIFTPQYNILNFKIDNSPKMVISLPSKEILAMKAFANLFPEEKDLQISDGFYILMNFIVESKKCTFLDRSYISSLCQKIKFFEAKHYAEIIEHFDPEKNGDADFKYKNSNFKEYTREEIHSVYTLIHDLGDLLNDDNDSDESNHSNLSQEFTESKNDRDSYYEENLLIQSDEYLSKEIIFTELDWDDEISNSLSENILFNSDSNSSDNCSIFGKYTYIDFDVDVELFEISWNNLIKIINVYYPEIEKKELYKYIYNEICNKKSKMWILDTILYISEQKNIEKCKKIMGKRSIL